MRSAEHVLDVTDEQARLLMAMSMATIDRSNTTSGSLLKSQVPNRTRAEWGDTVPGFVEIDLVAHERSHPAGQFCFTLTITDIATG